MLWIGFVSFFVRSFPLWVMSCFTWGRLLGSFARLADFMY